MAVEHVDVQTSAARLTDLAAWLKAGTDVVLCEGSTPIARIVPLAEAPRRIAGLHPGAFVVTDDFDAPLPDAFWEGAS